MLNYLYLSHLIKGGGGGGGERGEEGKRGEGGGWGEWMVVGRGIGRGDYSPAPYT